MDSLQTLLSELLFPGCIYIVYSFNKPLLSAFAVDLAVYSAVAEGKSVSLYSCQLSTNSILTVALSHLVGVQPEELYAGTANYSNVAQAVCDLVNSGLEIGGRDLMSEGGQLCVGEGLTLPHGFDAESCIRVSEAFKHLNNDESILLLFTSNYETIERLRRFVDEVWEMFIWDGGDFVEMVGENGREYRLPFNQSLYSLYPGKEHL